MTGENTENTCAGEQHFEWLGTTAIQWCTGRNRERARQQCIDGLVDAGVWPADQPAIVTHGRLHGHPGLRFSVTHTRQVVVMAVDPGPVAGLGVDVEWASRHVHPRLSARIGGPQDDPSHAPLERWVAKEASFKAYDPLRQQGAARPARWITEFWAARGQFGVRGDAQALGTLHIAHRVFAGEPWIMALARIP
ncbi:MAG: hypothetical protein ABF296_00720 [Oceanococcaceae bacterium]